MLQVWDDVPLHKWHFIVTDTVFTIVSIVYTCMIEFSIPSELYTYIYLEARPVIPFEL